METRYRIKAIPDDGSVPCYSAQAMPKETAEALAAKTIIAGFTHEVVEDTELLNGRYTVTGEVIDDAGPKFWEMYESLDLLLNEILSRPTYSGAVYFMNKFMEMWQEEHHTMPFDTKYIMSRIEAHYDNKDIPVVQEVITPEMTDEEILNVIKCRFTHSADEIAAMVCPVCGKKQITVGGFRQFATLCESEVDHCEEDSWTPPFRPVLVCGNENCVTHGKGYWAEIDLEWWRYRKGDKDLIGEPTTEKIQSIYSQRWVNGLQYENYEYRRGIYIGPNRISRAVKWYNSKVSSRLYRVKRCIHHFSNKHLGASYWTGWEHINKPERSRLGEYLYGVRETNKEEKSA